VKAELISITTDTHPLDGLYYEPPDGRPEQHVAQLFHGNTMNFYVGHNRFMPPALAAKGIAALAYNRRGHGILSIRDSRDVEGAALQLTNEALADNRYARTWLMARGHAAPVCIGHSNGGTLAVRHVADHPDTPALVLLSAHVGGRDVVPIASRNGLFGRDRLPEMLADAEQRMADGRGDELMLMPGWYWVTTPRSILDYASNLPHILEDAPRISCPVLFLRGDQEPPELYPAEEFKARCKGPVDIATIENCGHFYVGAEDRVNRMVCEWLERTLGTRK
jgi:pimeloyl-ACP methyl ester carboxylesterase